MRFLFIYFTQILAFFEDDFAVNKTKKNCSTNLATLPSARNKNIGWDGGKFKRNLSPLAHLTYHYYTMASRTLKKWPKQGEIWTN